MANPDVWTGCYRRGWGAELVPEAFAHPAKISFSLADRIYTHMADESWIAEGDTVIDPFGGIAGTAYHALQRGLNWVGVELEEKFVELGWGHDCAGYDKVFWRRFYGRLERLNYGFGSGHVCPECVRSFNAPVFGIIPSHESHRFVGNIDFWNSRYAGRFSKWGTAILIKGDSRRLLDVVRQLRLPGESREAGVCVSSPPYAESVHDGNAIKSEPLTGNVPGPNSQAFAGSYGSTPGNPGNLRAEGAGFAAALSSPPYAESMNGGEGGIDWQKAGRPERCAPGGSRHGVQGSSMPQRYGEADGQLGAMAAGDFAAAVSSPPYEGTGVGAVGNYKSIADLPKGIGDLFSADHKDYGYSVGQLGGESGDTFWSAALVILHQTYAALLPGGHAVWVVKAFVRNKAIVDFPGQWRQMAEAVGFVTLHEHRAMLVEEYGTQLATDGNHRRRKTERKSFFRRLAENKGSPAIDYEVVLCQEKRA